MKDKTNNPVSTDEPLQDDTRGNVQSAQELEKQQLNEFYEAVRMFHPNEQ